MESEHTSRKNKLYAGIIWILSGIALIIYFVMSMFNTDIPGIRELVEFLTTIEGKYIYIAAFISIFIEGLYIVGSFFPGASLVLLLAIISRASNPITFLTTIFLIFFGWCLAGVVNIYIATLYRRKIIKLPYDSEYDIKDRPWTTWFPAFRANYEVAQITEGGNAMKVFISSLRVRFFASLFVGVLAFVIPLFYDINQISTRESITTILIVAVISFVIGVVKIRGYLLSATSIAQ